MKAFEIPLPEVQKRLSFENPWWIAGNGIEPELRSDQSALLHDSAESDALGVIS